jgi:hypothetical protein
VDNCVFCHRPVGPYPVTITIPRRASFVGYLVEGVRECAHEECLDSAVSYFPDIDPQKARGSFAVDPPRLNLERREGRLVLRKAGSHE